MAVAVSPQNDVYVAAANGLAKVSPGTKTHVVSWAETFTGTVRGLSVADDGAGGVFLAGTFEGTISLFGSTLTSAGSQDAFIAKLSAVDGSPFWLRHLAATGANSIESVAVDAIGNPFVAGRFEGTIDLGQGPLRSAGDADILAAKLSRADGAVLWAATYGLAHDRPWEDRADGVAVTREGNLVLVGTSSPLVNFGAGGVGGMLGHDAPFAAYLIR
jgi:hypothetical protein